MTKADRDKKLRDIAAELKRIRDIPIRSLPEDALFNLITARNMLRAIPSPKSGD